mgnify:CR=1 FL=1
MSYEATTDSGDASSIPLTRGFGPDTTFLLYNGGVMTAKEIFDKMQQPDGQVKLIGADGQPRLVQCVEKNGRPSATFIVSRKKLGLDSFVVGSGQNLALKVPLLTKVQRYEWVGMCPYWSVSALVLDSRSVGHHVPYYRILISQINEQHIAESIRNEISAVSRFLEFDFPVDKFPIAYEKMTVCLPTLRRAPALDYNRDSTHIYLESLLREALAASKLPIPERKEMDALVIETAWLLGMWVTDGFACGPYISQNAEVVRGPDLTHRPALERVKRWIISVYRETDLRDRIKEHLGQLSPMPNYILNCGRVFKDILAGYGMVGNKKESGIGAPLLREAVDIRCALFEGIIDGDGSVAKDGFTIPSILKKMSSDYVSLARGLGFTASSSEYQRRVPDASGVIVTRTINITRISGYSSTATVIKPTMPHKRLRKVHPSKAHVKEGLCVAECTVDVLYNIVVEGELPCLLADHTIVNM